MSVLNKVGQYLLEHRGEDVGKDGDNDEKHEGEDDEGGKTAAEVLPTSKYIFVTLRSVSQKSMGICISVKECINTFITLCTVQVDCSIYRRLTLTCQKSVK